MNYFQKNLQLLKKYRPDLFEKIKNVKNKNYKITSSEHPKKYPNIIHIPTGKIFYDNSDPLVKVELKILGKKIKVPQLNFFMGFGLGYELLTFQQKFAATDSVMIVVEQDVEILCAALEVIDYESVIMDNRIIFIVGHKKEDLFVIIRNILLQGNLKLFVKAINIIENETSYLISKDYFSAFMKALKDAVREVLLYFGNDPWDSLIGIENTFLNIKEIINYPGIKDLKDKFKNKPGIVVATGPSLNKNVHLLKGLEEKAIFCAADASVKVMKAHGLKPHLVTSLERVLPTAKLFEGLTEEDVKDVYLSACPVIRPETYANFPGERIIVYRNFATFHWLEIEKGILDIGPSAANMAFKVLEFLGCNPIILIGQDLAFGEDDTTHAKGSTYGEKEKQYYRPERILEVEGNYKPKVKTTDVWYKFLKHYEHDIAHFNGSVINATEGGAKIHGSKIMTFKEAIDQYIYEDIYTLEIIRDSLRYPNETEKKENIEKVIKKTKEALEYCKYAIDEFGNGIENCKKFENEIIKPYLESKGDIDTEKASRLFYEVQKSLSIFGEKSFFYILMHYVQSYYIKTMVEIYGIQASENDINKANFQIVLLLKDMYAVMIELIKRMIILFEKLKGEIDKIKY